MKATGKEIKRFFNDPQWTHLRHNQYGIEEMIATLKKDQEYSLKEFGSSTDTNQDKIISFENAFKEWQRSKTHRAIVVEVPKEELFDVMDELKQRGFFVKKVSQFWKYTKLEE